MQIRERKHFYIIFTRIISTHNSPLISYDPSKDGVNTYEHA
jgi:hypothetical protein